MEAISYSKARANLAKTIDRVCDDHAPITITTSRDKNVVMMSSEDYSAMQETLYVLRNPKDALRLLKSIEALDKGKGKAKNLKG